MTTPGEQPLDIPDDLIVPLDQGSPNPYDDPDVKQDDFDESEKSEGFGGDTFPESPLNVNEALTRLHDLVASHTKVDWNGNQIAGYCLRIQHDASEIGPLHARAIDDWNDNPDQHPCTYETVDWTKVPRGAFAYNKSGGGGSGAGHIYRFCGMHNGKPLFVSNDLIPGEMSYLNDPTWFRIHWGQELVGWSRVCNGVWQKGIAGNEEKQPPPKHQGPQHENLVKAHHTLVTVIGLIDQSLEDNKDNGKFIGVMKPIRVELGDARRKLFPEAH
jgi:hypothetical protein